MASDDGQLRALENIRAEQLLEVVLVSRALQFCGDIGFAGVGHFHGVEHRAGRLCLQRIGAAVPEETALRHHGRRSGRDTRVLLRLGGAGGLRGEGSEIGRRFGFAGIGANAEVRLQIQVHQGRRRTIAFQRHVRSAQLHGEFVRRPIGMVRAVAGRARLFAGGGQRLVEENLLAELRDRAQRRDWRTREYDGIRIGARQVFHDGAHAGRYLRGEGDGPCAESDGAENHGGDASEQDVFRAREAWLLAGGGRYRRYDGVRHVNQRSRGSIEKTPPANCSAATRQEHYRPRQ